LEYDDFQSDTSYHETEETQSLSLEEILKKNLSPEMLKVAISRLQRDYTGAEPRNSL